MRNKQGDQFLWVEKYRPRKIADLVLPEKLKSTLQPFVDKGNLPHMILTGSPGVGKTSAAIAMVTEIGCEWILINGSVERNLDQLRTTIKDYAGTLSLDGKRKYVIYDEFDHSNQQTLQPGLRAFMEEYAANCGFLFTCNQPDRIIDAIKSRCAEVKFAIDKADKIKIGSQFVKICKGILDAEGVTYDEDAVVGVVLKYFPNFRKVINELQFASSTGSIDKSILKNTEKDAFRVLFDLIKSKDFAGMRKWVSENADNNPDAIFKGVVGVVAEKAPDAMPQTVLIVHDYMYKSAFVADRELNLTACFTELMAECDLT